ncbi:MAG: hypothetical protein V8Q43_00605 [Christensenellaceae bacterium]
MTEVSAASSVSFVVVASVCGFTSSIADSGGVEMSFPAFAAFSSSCVSAASDSGGAMGSGCPRKWLFLPFWSIFRLRRNF